MKSLIVLLAFASLSAQATVLSSFNVARDGGGQIEATIAESDEGMEITLLKCSFRDAPANTVAKVAGKDIVAAAKLVLAGKAIIAEDVSPRHMMPTGSWARMSYSLNANEFPEIHDEMALTKVVRSPIVIIDGKVSSILSDLEAQARKLCK